MDTSSPLFLVLDLTGVFAFALNGALTAIRVARLDIVGVLTLGMFTALGGGMVRDILLGALPPATFRDWRYLAVAATGSLVAFAFGRGLDRISNAIVILDAAGLSLFAVSGALKGMDFDVGVAQATILGAITAVGGGTMRDVLIREVPAVLTSGLYAIPALVGAFIAAGGAQLGTPALPTALVAAGTCFAIRMLGVVLGLDAPGPPRTRRGA
ncbi:MULTISPECIES: trimeric intracellular cation channel family protein [unclassified Nocardioides]|uniref:trimeric intracellular cation channel family protein n=1 Tax=Nocardioides sp. URHA0032 TaxID=1380388 RepID=UPI00048F8B93|nr:trimeric intracellular cation channel family protein [Nocardioides sp. URHA0032]